MSVRPSYESLAVAGRFFSKFGFGTIAIEKFDLFIIDEKMATDPETDETSAPAYRGFITERSQARNKLNRGAAHFSTPFCIDVSRAGVEYVVSPWSQSAATMAQEMGNRVRDYAAARFEHLKRLNNRAEQLLLSNPEDRELQETTAMLGLMRQEGVQLQAKVSGLVLQYNAAAEAVEAQVTALIDRYEVPEQTLLEHHDDQDDRDKDPLLQ